MPAMNFSPSNYDKSIKSFDTKNIDFLKGKIFTDFIEFSISLISSFFLSLINNVSVKQFLLNFGQEKSLLLALSL
jgi:hypothetical protein